MILKLLIKLLKGTIKVPQLRIFFLKIKLSLSQFFLHKKGSEIKTKFSVEDLAIISLIDSTKLLLL